FDMRGIWCIFGSSVDTHQQVPSCFNIAHRSSDCFRFENVNHFSKCVFGFYRLTIVDNIYGMQPMRITVVSNQSLKVEPVESGTYEEYKLNKNEKVQFVKKERFHSIETFPKYDVNVNLTGN
ncbi:unnamed protein product, partial [Rotaria sp. Silwood2]